ncbi:MAG: protein kinase [Chloroflexi bacterium]|nr:protein kinase [Chloroflexota bacterium]
MLTEVGRYQIIRKIGQGGMAVVYLAQDPHIHREVAIKIMNTQALQSEELRARFDQEAQTIASLDHPCIVPIYDYGEVGGAPYLVMRYMVGGTLDNWLRQGALPLPTILEILQRLARALDEAHRRGVVHRDLKPGNILFDQRQTAFLSDFGIVKRLNASVNLTQGLSTIGTPAYMSPEQALGGTELDGRADIYSLGVVLFEMLTGQRPFQAADSMALLHAHVYEPVPPLHQFNPHLPDEYQPLVEKAMAKKREQRFATAGELVQAIEPLVGGAPPNAVVPPSPTFTPPTVSAYPLKPPDAAGLSTAERLKRQIKRLPVWVRLLIMSLAFIALALGLFRVLADSVAGSLTGAAVTTPPPTGTLPALVAQDTPANLPETATLPAGTLVLLEWDDSAIWQKSSSDLARIPSDGLISFAGTEPQTLQTNAGSLELILPDRSRLYLDANTTLQIERVEGVGGAEDTAVTLLSGHLVAQPAGQFLRIASRPAFTPKRKPALSAWNLTPTAPILL